MTDEHDDQPPRPVWIYLAAAGAVIVVSAVALLVAAPSTPTRDGMTGSTPSTETQEVSCLVVGNLSDEVEQCVRAAADYKRRRQLTEAQLADTRTATTDIGSVLSQVGACTPIESPTCRGGGVYHPPGSKDVEAVIAQLVRAGYEAEARIARGADPAPPDSLLYAVEVGDQVCVIGYTRELPIGRGSGMTTVGTLPSGRCLDS